jgi:hypothetical protein
MSRLLVFHSRLIHNAELQLCGQVLEVNEGRNPNRDDFIIGKRIRGRLYVIEVGQSIVFPMSEVPALRIVHCPDGENRLGKLDLVVIVCIWREVNVNSVDMESNHLLAEIHFVKKGLRYDRVVDFGISQC